jgi:hypothetical protein
VTVLYDEPRALDPVWNASWRIDPRPDGSHAPDGPLVRAVEDKIEPAFRKYAVAHLTGA